MRGKTFVYPITTITFVRNKIPVIARSLTNSSRTHIRTRIISFAEAYRILSLSLSLSFNFLTRKSQLNIGFSTFGVALVIRY